MNLKPKSQRSGALPVLVGGDATSGQTDIRPYIISLFQHFIFINGGSAQRTANMCHAPSTALRPTTCGHSTMIDESGRTRHKRTSGGRQQVCPMLFFRLIMFLAFLQPSPHGFLTNEGTRLLPMHLPDPLQVELSSWERN